MHNRFIIALISLLLAASPTFGHGSTAERADVALEEKLGGFIAGDAAFIDDSGRAVKLNDLINKPTIIAPVYLGCSHACPMLLTGLAQALGKLTLVKPGRDFNVIALSFDEKDTPALALEKKKNYLKAVGRPFPADAWKFLTGDLADIKKATASIGFTFQRDGEHDFSHPITLVVLAQDGRIVRYLEGSTFLPFEVTMALTEAAEGRVGSPMRKALLYCFSYDPLKKSYVFSILKITAVVMILFVASFLFYLMTSRKGGAKG